MKDSPNIRTRYDLPDSFLLEPDGRPRAMKLWIPSETMVVIGNGSDADTEIISEAIQSDRIPIVRRGTGGCAVVIGPEMAVVSFAVCAENQKGSQEYFRVFNSILIDALTECGVESVSHRGRSDIAIEDRKIAGTALYRNKRAVFYHAVINLAGDPMQLDRYLKHPPREPDYRANRKHSDFVTSLKAAGYEISIEDLEARISQLFHERKDL